MVLKFANLLGEDQNSSATTLGRITLSTIAFSLTTLSINSKNGDIQHNKCVAVWQVLLFYAESLYAGNQSIPGAGCPHWAIFCQLGYFWKLIMILEKRFSSPRK
jgi:hypothetical protein